MKKHPTTCWYIKVTEENQDILSKWRLKAATNFLYKHTIDIGYFILSSHPDGSCYFSGSEDHLLERFPNYKSIDFETFKEITQSEMLPKDWYIEVTKQNILILDQWRLWAAGSHVNKDIRPGQFVLSKHYSDESHFWANGSESTLLSVHPGYVKIDLETFLQITQVRSPMKNYTINYLQAQSIIDIACTTWKETLFNMWGKDIILKNPINIGELDYKSMRSACTQPQNQLFDTIFGKQPNLKVGDWVKIVQPCVDRSGDVFQLNESNFIDVRANSDIRYDGANWQFPEQVRLATGEEINTAKYPKDGTACLVRCSTIDGWELRYANGKGRFYTDGRKSGNISSWDYWMVLDTNNLPVEN